MNWDRNNCALMLTILSCPAWQPAITEIATSAGPVQRASSGPNQQTKLEEQEQDVRQKIRVRSDLVVLSVTVNDGRGNLVSGLRQEDFQVFDDEVEQKIVVFADEGLPLSLVVLVDSDMKWKEGTEVTKSLRAITSGLSEADEAMVCRYDMLFYPGEGFTSVSGNLIGALKDAQIAAEPSPRYVPQPLITDGGSTTGPPNLAAPTYAGSRPSKALDDAIYSATELLQSRGSDRRKVVLVISDGGNEPKLNHHTHENVVELLLRDNVSVFSLAVGTDRAKRKFSELADYVTASGGDIFHATKSGAMENLYARITEQARHDYAVVYAPVGNNRDSFYHAVKVTIKTGLTANTRKGYYASNSETPKD